MNLNCASVLGRPALRARHAAAVTPCHAIECSLLVPTFRLRGRSASAGARLSPGSRLTALSGPVTGIAAPAGAAAASAPSTATATACAAAAAAALELLQGHARGSGQDRGGRRRRRTPLPHVGSGDGGAAGRTSRWSRRQAVVAGTGCLLSRILPTCEAGADPSTGDREPARSLRERLLQNARLVNPRMHTPGLFNNEGLCTYPMSLFGEWEVRSTPVAFAEPLGQHFVDEDTRAAIRDDFAPGRRKELSWRARFYWASLDAEGVPLRRERGPGSVARSMPPFGVTVAGPPTPSAPPAGRPGAPGRVVQYRAFNAGQEVRAFLDQRVPRVISEADPKVQPLKVWIAFPVDEGMGEDEEAIRTVTLRLDACSTEEGRGTFVSSELFRQTVSTEGQVDTVGDFEVINEYSFSDLERGRISVRNRVAKYLVPGDPLYHKAGGAAVSWLDYDWTMSRTGTCIDTPYGKQCLERA
uniref:Uncharacterized protein n=1 Tax=Alexandrium monilatum TaxID=311494 RepID=A0A7S4WFW9_9DINO|mmetsp:Transcript_63638/g.201149  ORF Transcript_63638/g.201149 Transcript_63638/m.201149 type:complete len:470 (-) Transcript_63638:279-1688(-)